ncbi:MAG: hypothetical protein ACRDSJ_04825 [Rubrobacteraceae bacterium]
MTGSGTSMSRQLIVAGFHRSGTSLVCQLLGRAGLFLGYELLGANRSNPYGHFEDVEILDLHKQILADNGKTWRVDEPFSPVLTDSHWRKMRRIIERRGAEHEAWGFKDPRVCLFLMVWKHLLPNARVLLVYRSFADSTHSLVRRRAMEMFSKGGDRQRLGQFWDEPDLALRMWLVHNEALIAFARAYPEDTLTVSLDMVRDGFPLAGAVNRRWDFGLDDVRASEVFDPSVTFGRHGRQPVSDGRLIPRVEKVWRELVQMSEKTRQLMTGGAAVAGR